MWKGGGVGIFAVEIMYSKFLSTVAKIVTARKAKPKAILFNGYSNEDVLKDNKKRARGDSNAQPTDS